MIAIPAIISGLIGSHIGIESYDNYSNYYKSEDAYKEFQRTLEEKGLEDLTLDEMIDYLYREKALDTKEYEKALKKAEDYIESYDINDFGQFFYSLFTSDKSTKQTQELFETLTNAISKVDPNIPYEDLSVDTLNNYSQSIKDSIEDAPTPGYLDTSFKGEQIEVDPVKFWTGQELADLHDINYNPNHYYDLIKDSNEAELAYARYGANQIAHAGDLDQTARANDYLNNIRNIKSEAIATGATLGAQRAAELLNTSENFADYVNNQSTVGQERFSAVDDAIRQDAQSRLTARNYFDQLAQSLSEDSITLYANDSDRYGQEMLSNAEMYAADQALRGQRILANAEMEAAQRTANANIAASRAQASAVADEYAWVFDKFLKANDGNYPKAYAQFGTYIDSKYTGYGSYREWINAMNQSK